MPRKKSPPSYRLHKARNCAVVTINRRNHYLGPYESAESYEKYARLIADWEAPTADQPPTVPVPGAGYSDLSVNEMLLRYWKFAQGYYASNGTPSKELACMKEAMRPLKALYGHSRARDFGPLALKAVREHMIDADLSRGVVNHRVNRIRRIFRWAASEELIPADKFDALRTVTGLRYGRTSARETEPVGPAPSHAVEAVMPFVPPQIAAMIQLQRLTGMRPGEVVMMRACDIDMTEDVWIYQPRQHKNQWRGHRRIVPLGPKAQEVLKPFLDRSETAYLFNPREAEAWRREHRLVHTKVSRKTPIYPSELRAREEKKKARRLRKPKRVRWDRYDTGTYRKAIEYGFVKAKKDGVVIPHWSPNQLRHCKATEVRKTHGIEAAQVVLGHARADVTQVYAERDLELAKRVAREAG
jgi:integrase